MDEKPKRTRIPVPGNSGAVPTGAMQFQQDWPGLFLRGDDAIMVAISIRQLEQRLASSEDPHIGMALDRLTRIADIIERDVKVKPDESE